MGDRKYQSIPVKSLLIRPDNPRFDPVNNQRQAMALIASDQNVKLVNLGQHILERGTNPSDIPIVTPTDDGELFIVLEGNRRVTALKMLSSPGIAGSLGLSPSLTKRWKALEAQASGSAPGDIMCVVMSREDAQEWIGLKHTGENEGKGVVGWDGRATQRFRGDSPASQAIDMVEKAGYLVNESKTKLRKIPITNVERVLGTPDARKYLGVDIVGGKLVFQAPEEEALGRLAILVCDVLHGRVKVTHLDRSEQRVAYAQKVAETELPKPYEHGTGSEQAGDNDKTGKATKPTQKHRADRATLIPKSLGLSIPQTRINQIYDELQRHKVENFENSCAVLMRVFLELSIDEYADRNGIKPKLSSKLLQGQTPVRPPGFRDLHLRKKILAVVDYMQENSVCGKEHLQGITQLAQNKDHVLSLDSLHAYVHNQHYNPNHTDLKTNWDSIQAFIVHIWA